MFVYIFPNILPYQPKALHRISANIHCNYDKFKDEELDEKPRPVLNLAMNPESKGHKYLDQEPYW